MEVPIEFNGLAREIVGAKEITLSMEEGATYSDIVERLAKLYPRLIDILIEPNERCLLNANFFSRGAEDVIFPAQMEQTVMAGQKLYLISIIVGG